MASLKDIKRQIGAVKQTEKITKAMNMVAASKLRAIQHRTEQFRNYADKYEELMGELAKRAEPGSDALLTESSNKEKVAILAIASDRGLCGSYNAEICNKLDKQIFSLKAEGYEVELYLIGRKLKDYYLKRPVKVMQELSGIMNKFDYLDAQKIANQMISSYRNSQYSKIYLFYTKFVSIAQHFPINVQLLPVSQENFANTGEKQGDYEIEPSPTQLLSRLIPRSLSILVYRAMLESSTSENASRMQAMDNAAKNCKELIESISLAYNKARQAAVTTELLDIVSGAEALKNS